MRLSVTPAPIRPALDGDALAAVADIASDPAAAKGLNHLTINSLERK